MRTLDRILSVLGLVRVRLLADIHCVSEAELRTNLEAHAVALLDYLRSCRIAEWEEACEPWSAKYRRQPERHFIEIIGEGALTRIRDISEAEYQALPATSNKHTYVGRA